MAFNIIYKSNDEEEEKKRKKLIEEGANQQLERNRQANEQFNRNYEERNNFFNNVGRVADSFLTGLGTTAANVGTGVLSVINDDPVNLATRSARDNLIGKIENTDLAGYAEKLKAIKNPTEQKIDWLSDIKRQNEAKIQNLQSQTDSEVARNIIGFVPNLSQQAVNIGASLVNPGLGMAVATAGAKGSYLDVAKQRGMNEEESRTFSNIMAVVEGATEMIGINNITKGIKGVNALAKTGIKGAKKEIQKEIVDTAIKSYGKSILDNAVQEAITEPIQEAVADITAKKGDWNNVLGRSLESGFSGALTAAITGGASMGISSAVGYVQKLNNGYKPTQAETIQAVNQIYNEATENQKQVLNYAIKDGVEIATQQSVLPTEENGLKSNVETNNTILDSAERNGIDVKDEKTRKNLETIQKFNENRGIEATFDAEAFKGHDNINSFFRTDENGNREIVFNPNTMTDKTIEQLAVHEVYHDMVAGGTAQELTDLVVQKMSGNQEYQDYINALQDVYGEQDSSIITEEAVAHYLEKNLGTNEFISELQQRGDRTTIQKIIDAIKDMITKVKNTLTGKGDLNYLLDLQRKYEQAYRGEFKGTQEQTKLSKQVDENITYPKNVKEIKNLNDFIRKARENETDAYWSNQLDEASQANYTDWARKESRLHWKRNLIQQYLDYKNGENSLRFSKSTDAQGNTTYNLDAKDLSTQDIVDNIKNTEGTLLAIHNLSEEKLRGILELGGFPVPSIAITNPNKVGHEQFGDISVVFDKSAIDPNNPLNEVYDRDVWSPVFPNVEYDIKNEDIKKFVTDKYNYDTRDGIINDAIIKYMYSENLSTQLERYGKEKTLDNLKNDKSLQYFYKTQVEKDASYSPEMKQQKYSNLHENTTLQKFIDEFNKTHDMSLADFYYHYLNYRDMELSQSERTTLENQIKEVIRPEIEEYYKKHNPFKDRNVPNASEVLNNAIQEELNADVQGWNFENFIRDASQLEKNGETQIIDEEKTLNNISEQINKEKYNKWVDDTFGEMFKNVKKGIRNNKDTFTASGNRRSFEQLHSEYNLGNVVKEMTTKSTQGGEGGFTSGGFGEIQAKRGNKYTSIDEIKANEDRITTSEQANEQLQPLKEKIQSDIAELSDYYKSVSNYSTGFDSSANAISEFAEKKNLTEANLKKVLNSYYNFDVENIPKSLYADIITDLKKLDNIYTDYFEAKPQRAVGFDEVATIVIPKDMTELSQALQDRGLDVIKYDPDVEGDRQSKLDALSEYKFSKQGQGTSQQTINEFLENTKVNEGTGTAIKDLARVQKQSKQILPTTPAEEVTEMERPQLPQSQKSRKFYRSVIESDNTTAEAKQISRELMGYDSYTPQTNKLTLEQADRNIELNGTEGSLTTLTNKINNNDRITATDIAIGQRLMQYYSKIGDKARLQEAIQDTAMAGTEAGRSVQAFAMLNHQTPEGQVTWIQRSIDKINKRLQKEGRKEQFEFTPEMQQEILNSTDENRQQVLNKVYKELGEQVPKSHMEQFNEWRYFSMLFNPKTHFRNILGNAVMKQVQNIKNKVAGTIEDIVIGDNKERWNSLKRASKGTYEFAKNDLKNADVKSQLGLNENKYNPQNRLKQNQRTFKSNALENTLGRLFYINSKALEVEDGWGLKSAYAKAMTNYLTANKLDYNNLTDTQLQKARNYAVQQAKEATFHQENLMANYLQTIEDKNLVTKIAVGGIVPFKKTPMNVALTGFEYSPAGFIKTFTSDIVNLRKGKISPNQFIDNISKNLTGTGIAVLGYALTQAGKLKASVGDDDKEKYEETRGKQNYSLQIGDNTYSLDWLTPAGIPLFIGSELYQISHKDEKETAKGENQALKSISSILDATSTAMNPMSEMSMISGLTSALKSYSQGSSQALANIGTNTLKSYVTQAVPTALGQIARTSDDKERSTTTTETNPFTKALDSTKNQIMSKIPGLRQLLPVSTDVWGNERKTTNYAENAILPWTRKEIKEEPLDKELTRLYDATGESSVIPDTYIDKTLTIAKEKYRLSNEEYADLKKQYGQTSYKILSNLTSSSDYKNMTDEQKVKAVTEAYKYAKASLKVTYADWNNLDADANSTYKKVQNVIDKGGDAKDYFTYVGLTDGLKTETEKNRALRNSDLGSKSAIYESTTGSDDQIYPIMKKAKTNINAYLDYKLADIQGIKNEEGKTISGSKKQAFNDYLNSSKMNYNQKLLLKGVNYKLTNYEKNLLLDYLDTLKLSDNEYNDVLLKLK